MGLKTHKKPTVKMVPPSPEPSTDEDDSAVESSDEDQPSPTSLQHHIAPSKLTKIPSPSPDPQSGSDDEEEEEEDDDEPDEEDEEETRTRTPTPSPLPQPKPTPKATPSKRSAVSEPNTAFTEKKKYKQEDKDKPSLSPHGNSKGLFVKIWSSDDEALILNRIMEFRTAKGSFGTVNHSEVFESIRDRLSVPDLKKEQFTNKVKRLKDRYLKIKSGKKSVTGPNDELVLKVGDLVWIKDFDKNHSTKINGNVDGNPRKNDKKAREKGKGFAGEMKEIAVEEQVVEEEEEEEKVKKEWKVEKCKGGVEGTDSGGEIELDVEYMKSTNKMIKAAMKNMSEEERNEVNEKLRKADARFKEAYCLKLEVLLKIFKKND